MEGASDNVVTSRNPATGAIVAETPVSSPEDVTQAVQSARDAFRPWSSLPVEDRAEVLVRFAELVERDRNELAALVVPRRRGRSSPP
ncbi:MAG: aldehyde dehydrogenase family protein [Actinomycetota bacterium]|nr:aldehyde dehydrogenase family protein [Actinomycetota bacterium]